jgi:hypothetical protein
MNAPNTRGLSSTADLDVVLHFLQFVQSLNPHNFKNEFLRHLPMSSYDILNDGYIILPMEKPVQKF